jgi:CheY-like chemotaxis protein
MPTVLVVDDSPDICYLARFVLSRDGFEVKEAHSGAAALALLADGRLPDLVLLDVQMPVMDGWETLEAIRRDPHTADLLVLLFTVKGRAEDTLRGWELGCDGYVAKPFDTSTLRSEVHRVIALTADARERERAAGREEARKRLAAESKEQRWRSVLS